MYGQTKQKRLIIVFTDLDGTLLDHYSYSFEKAHEALQKISSAQIPLIICTSKTRAEIEVWRKKLNNDAPFISENGGAIFFPREKWTFDKDKIIDKDEYKIIELGMKYSELLARFRSIKNIFRERIQGFSDMGIGEVAHLTGLSRDEAALAMKREYTEPFLFDGDEEALKDLQKKVTSLKLNLTRGGRFFHLLGNNDKGKAVRIVIERYQKQFEYVKAIALGDSYNDLSMLKAVDFPILVQKPGGLYDKKTRNLPNLVRAPGVGPIGWNSALLKVLGETLASS
ncbi:MAG TPA: HAD-IIB family hydrolase [Thermodesulfobacteriota bacterium]|nr:HAD-IIB family hydrolase [Thermodesulfobacteriota bacterium]